MLTCSSGGDPFPLPGDVAGEGGANISLRQRDKEAWGIPTTLSNSK